MENLQTYIDDFIAEKVGRREIVDVHEVARTIHAAFSNYSLAQVAQLVSAAVVARRGNAEWQDRALE